MDLSDPTRSITTSLDGPVLAVLAGAGSPLTVGEIARRAPRGTEVGVRRSVERLVVQGTVIATQMGPSRVHELNRDHVAAEAAVVLSDLRLELWRRLRAALESWEPAPLYACAFGSAARGDGSAESDIDLLLVHPAFPGDPARAAPRSLAEIVRGVSVQLTTLRATEDDEERWQEGLDELHDDVRRWTGNELQVIDIGIDRWVAPSEEDEDAFFREIRLEAVELIRGRFSAFGPGA